MEDVEERIEDPDKPLPPLNCKILNSTEKFRKQKITLANYRSDYLLWVKKVQKQLKYRITPVLAHEIEPVFDVFST